MALWKFEIELPNGSRESNVVAAGNRTAAEQRVMVYAASREGRLVSGPDAVDAVKGSM